MLRMLLLASLLLLSGSVSATILSYDCQATGTVTAIADHPLNWAFANNTNQVCSTSLNGNVVTIDGCNPGSDIFLVFTERTSTASSFILGGVSYKAFIIRCSDLGHLFTRNLQMTHQPTFTLRGNLTITPHITIASAVRRFSPTGQERTEVTVGKLLYWTIDIPEEYYGLPQFCYALPGGSDPTLLNYREDLISNGCSLKPSLLEDFSIDNTINVDNKRRYYTKLFAFRYVDFPNIRLVCSFKFCVDRADCEINCTNSGRRRRDILDMKEFKAGLEEAPKDELHNSGLMLTVKYPEEGLDEDEQMDLVVFGASPAARAGSTIAALVLGLFFWRLT